MAIRPKGATAAVKPAEATPTPAAAPAARGRIKPKAAAPAPAEEPATPAEATVAPAAPVKIMTAAERARAAKAAPAAKPDAATGADEDADDLSWTHTGDDALAKAKELAAQKEQAKQERRERGYWPIRFGLIPPSTQNPDRYMADILILDAKVGPSYYEHVLRNAKSGRWDVYEPCPKEFDNCCLCPPASERDSQYVMLLSVMNLAGYTYKTGDRAGQHVPITKELMAVMVGDQPYFHQLQQEHGSLRGIQLTMTRQDRYDPNIGKPAFIGKFTDEQMESYIKTNGLWQKKTTREGEVIGEEDHLMQPFNYAEFLHKPSGKDLRARYGNTGGTPGSVGGADNNQWGNSRYQPGTAGGPGGAAGGLAGGAGRSLDDLDDDIPF